MQVDVVYCPAPGRIDQVALDLPAGATLADALAASGIAVRHDLPPETLRVGIWGREKPPETLLREHDRVEVYRPLLVDPKEARRQRYRKAGPGRVSGNPTR
jgi:uncharacterized protein